jgi:hypothetical protein
VKYRRKRKYSDFLVRRARSSSEHERLKRGGGTMGDKLFKFLE